jgi:hypothetical protein
MAGKPPVQKQSSLLDLMSYGDSDDDASPSTAGTGSDRAGSIVGYDSDEEGHGVAGRAAKPAAAPLPPAASPPASAFAGSRTPGPSASPYVDYAAIAAATAQAAAAARATAPPLSSQKSGQDSDLTLVGMRLIPPEQEGEPDPAVQVCGALLVFSGRLLRLPAFVLGAHPLSPPQSKIANFIQRARM